MEPITETRMVIDELTAFGAVGLLEGLVDTAETVREVIPGCVAVSLRNVEHGVGLVVVATAAELAALAETAGAAPGAPGVVSTLTLPVADGDRWLGAYDLYAVTPGAFDAHRDALARLVGARVDEVVADGDLDFSTHDTARLAPTVLRDARSVDIACGLLAAQAAGGVDRLRGRILAAAAQTGVSPAALARSVIEAMRPGSP